MIKLTKQQEQRLTEKFRPMVKKILKESTLESRLTKAIKDSNTTLFGNELGEVISLYIKVLNKLDANAQAEFVKAQEKIAQLTKSTRFDSDERMNAIANRNKFLEK